MLLNTLLSILWIKEWQMCIGCANLSTTPCQTTPLGSIVVSTRKKPSHHEILWNLTPLWSSAVQRNRHWPWGGAARVNYRLMISFPKWLRKPSDAEAAKPIVQAQQEWHEEMFRIPRTVRARPWCGSQMAAEILDVVDLWCNRLLQPLYPTGCPIIGIYQKGRTPTTLVFSLMFLKKIGSNMQSRWLEDGTLSSSPMKLRLRVRACMVGFVPTFYCSTTSSISTNSKING